MCTQLNTIRTLDWIIQFHQISNYSIVSFDDSFIREYVISPLDDFLKLSSKKKLDFEKVIEGLAGFKNLRLSFTTRHGDFNPYNIIVDKTK